MSTSAHPARDLHFSAFRFWPWTIAAAATIIALFVSWIFDARYLPLTSTAVIWFAWAFGVWPRATLTATGIVARNTFQTAHIPYREVAALRAGYALDVVTNAGRRVRLWAVPGPRNFTLDAIRRGDAFRGGAVPIRHVDDLRVGRGPTAPSNVAGMIEMRAARAKDASRRGATEAGAPGVEAVDEQVHETSLNVPIVLGSALAIAVLFGPLWGEA